MNTDLKCLRCGRDGHLAEDCKVPVLPDGRVLVGAMTTTPPPMPSYGIWDTNIDNKRVMGFTPEQVIERDAQWMERITALEAALKKANDQAEHFEREWYLRGDAIERLEADRKMLREALVDLLEAAEWLTGGRDEDSLSDDVCRATRLARAALESPHD